MSHQRTEKALLLQLFSLHDTNDVNFVSQNNIMLMNILVVDDERDMQALFEQRFRKEIRNGMVQFAFAISGEEALSYLNQHEHEAVLILSDINMPGMSGLELLRHIKQQYSHPPPVVMMVTAYGD